MSKILLNYWQHTCRAYCYQLKNSHPIHRKVLLFRRDYFLASTVLSHQLRLENTRKSRNSITQQRNVPLTSKFPIIARHYVIPPLNIGLDKIMESADEAGIKDGLEDEFSENSEEEDFEEESNGASHVPVMVEEVLQALKPKDGQILIDMTFGAGGHAREILKVAPNLKYFASDRDPLAHDLALKLAAEYRQEQITPILGRFSELPLHLHQYGVKPGTVDAFLFDLGVSSMQFDTPERGFALSQDGPLDMRMERNRCPDFATAADVVNSLDAHDLAHILKKYGEEKKAYQIAHAIVEARYAFGNFTRTKQLADVISSVFSCGAMRHDKLFRHTHVATKTFQALRIFVNNELNEIHNGIEIARHYLKPHGRCAVISFHSLEDRIVKRHFHDIDMDEASNLSIHHHFLNSNVIFDNEAVAKEFFNKPWLPISRKVMQPTQVECLRNPRARSAKLRAAIKQELKI